MTMPMSTELLPDEIKYGFVYGKTLLAVGDTLDDTDMFPDGVPAKGTVRFTPRTTILRTDTDPATIVKQPIECDIHQGKNDPHDPDPDKAGLLIDAAGFAGNVALIVGQYNVSYRLEGGAAVPGFVIEVNPAHTEQDPLILALVAPFVPSPAVEFVVNQQVYNDTLTARDEAVPAVTGFRQHALAYVKHDSDSTVARPSDAAAVYWFGSVEPDNIENGDMWIAP